MCFGDQWAKDCAGTRQRSIAGTNRAGVAEELPAESSPARGRIEGYTVRRRAIGHDRCAGKRSRLDSFVLVEAT
jgi:hypothetical protein